MEKLKLGEEKLDSLPGSRAWRSKVRNLKSGPAWILQNPHQPQGERGPCSFMGDQDVWIVAREALGVPETTRQA